MTLPLLELVEAGVSAEKQAEKTNTLEQQLWELGIKMTTGNHLPSTSRVFQLKNNPAEQHFALRREELQRLQAENSALLKRLTTLEEGLGIAEAEALVPKETWINLNREKDELLNVVAEKEKRLLRLKQVCCQSY